MARGQSVYGETSKMSEKAFSQNLGQGKQTHITTKLMLAFLSNLQYQKRLIFSHMYALSCEFYILSYSLI